MLMTCTHRTSHPLDIQLDLSMVVSVGNRGIGMSMIPQVDLGKDSKRHLPRVRGLYAFDPLPLLKEDIFVLPLNLLI